jgi:hypothetical protein
MPHDIEASAKHLALLAAAGLVTAEPGERRRVRYRLRSAPMQVAQQFLAALARDWDGTLGALTRPPRRGCLRTTRRACPQGRQTPPHEPEQHHG